MLPGLALRQRRRLDVEYDAVRSDRACLKSCARAQPAALFRSLLTVTSSSAAAEAATVSVSIV
jgi:hypothetical protein